MHKKKVTDILPIKNIEIKNIDQNFIILTANHLLYKYWYK